jgi:hypothetical protein
MTAMTVQTTALCLLWEQNIVGVVSSQICLLIKKDANYN